MPTLTFVKRVDMPVATRGVGSGKPSVTVQGNGTFLFSTKSAEIFGPSESALFILDGQKITVQAVTDSIIKDLKKQKLSIDDLATCKFTRGKKSKGVGLAGSGIAKMVGYDYKTSGNQSFEVEGDVDENSISFTLPKGSLTPKPKVARKPRADKKANGVTTMVPTGNIVTTGATQNPTSPSQDAELILQEA